MKDDAPVIKPIKRSTLGVAIIEQLNQLILDGAYKPGEQLPSERDLASQFGVARGPVREALRALALVGLIEIKPGLGAFVRDRDSLSEDEGTIADMVLQEVANVRDVYEARKVIETGLIMLAAEKVNPEQLEKLQQLMVSMQCVENQVPCPVEDFIQLHSEFDLIVAEAAGNRVLLEIFRSLRKLEQEAHKKVLRLPEAVMNSNRQHEAILRALTDHDLEAAEWAAKLHFGSVEPLLKNRLEEENID